jgi:hypothetical protein
VGADPISSLTEPLIPLVMACGSSRVWKVGPLQDAESDGETDHRRLTDPRRCRRCSHGTRRSSSGPGILRSDPP